MTKLSIIIVALGSVFGDGCTSSDSRSPTADAGGSAASNRLELAVPRKGVQITTQGRTIPAGNDQEWCEVVELPGDPDQVFYVGGMELAMTPFSHHLIVSMAPERSTTLHDAALGAPIQCPGAHIYGIDLVTLAATSEPYSSRELPAGIGLTVRGGQRLVFDYHSLNTSAQPIHAQHRLNLHFVDHIDKPARTFGFYNQYIEVPAHTARTFTDDCRFKDAVLIWSLARHTHRYGTDFRVFWAGGDNDGELIWTSTDWEQDIAYDFREPVVVPAGTGFRWECSFDNPTNATLQFGPQATDEMCILFGSFAAVGDDASVPPQSCYRFEQ